MPPQVRAGVEAARRTASERAFRKFALMTLRMDLEVLSQKHAKTLAETGQGVQITGQPSRTEKLLWAAALAPDDAEAQALFAKARDLAARDRPSARRAAISTADWLWAFFPASPRDRLRSVGLAPPRRLAGQAPAQGCSAGARARAAAQG